MNNIFLYVLVIILLNGCSIHSDFTAITSKNINLSNIKFDKKLSKGKTSGENCQYIISFIPTSGPPSPKEALDQALEAKEATLLLDAVLWHKWFYIPLIYGQDCWKANGEAYDTFK